MINVIFYEEAMNIEDARKMVDENSWDAFLAHFQNKYPKRRLYSCSKDWYKDEKYICKVKGVRGDILIGWYGIHIKQPKE